MTYFVRPKSEICAPGGQRLLAEHTGASVYHATWHGLLDVVPTCDALIFDAPYSEKTHNGHASGAQTANRAKAWAERQVDHGGKRTAEQLYALLGKGERRKINYDPWSPDDVESFVSAWSPRVCGWFVTITDSVLAPVWRAALEAAGRYTFDPLPYVAPGSRVRMTGDGPSCWTTWIVVGEAAESVGDRIVVARPRTAEAVRWGTLPGAYVLPKGYAEDLQVVGGKPIWLMKALVRDYSRPGDLIVDPTAGAGTTLLAAQHMGRRSVGGDALLEHAQLAADRIQQREPTYQALI